MKFETMEDLFLGEIQDLNAAEQRLVKALPGMAEAAKVPTKEECRRIHHLQFGFAANRLLAKIACKVNKPDGVTIWHPSAMPTPLLAMPLSAIPGVGGRMRIMTMAGLLAT